MGLTSEERPVVLGGMALRWIVLCVVAIPACRTSNVEVTAAPTDARAATDIGTVVVYADQDHIDRPIEEIGVLRFTAVDASSSHIEYALKIQAASMGAHAVIRERQSAVVSGWFFKSEQVDGWARAVRFADED